MDDGAPGSFDPEKWKSLSPEAKARLIHRLKYDWRLHARPSQLEPPDPDWFVWMMCSGRGAGKTRSGAEWMKQRTYSEVEYPHEVYASIVAPTFALCKSVCFEGESGLINVLPPEAIKKWNRTELLLILTNGSEIRGYSANEYERIRGSQAEFVWFDEIASATYADEAWEQLMLTLRLGRRPRALITTTPRPIHIIKDLVSRDGQDVRLVRESTFANAANLPAGQLAWLKRQFEGSYLGEQELYAQIIDDVRGALWSREQLEGDRVKVMSTDRVRVVVGVDPAVTANKNSDETGIVVAALGADLHGYVLEDLSGKYGPDEWAQVVAAAYTRWNADLVVAEVNNGGDLVENTVKTVDPYINYKGVRASRGKIIRAEPIAALYTQHRMHHVGLPAGGKVEDQMCSFVPGDKKSGSPDRMDALVWCFTELMLGGGLGETGYFAPDSAARAMPGSWQNKFGPRIQSAALTTRYRR